MKKLGLLFVAIVLGVGYVERGAIIHASEKYIYYSPCDTPIPYSIGSVDPRFAITTGTFREDIEAATAIWSTVEGKPLFVYDPQSPFTISMVYDQRQLLNSQINQLHTQLDTQNNSIKPQLSEYNQKVIDFKQKVANLNQQISSWNAKGGAPEEVFNQLKQQQASLQQEQDQLKAMALQLNQSTDSYNNQVSELNQDVTSFNQALQVKPEEGLYTQDGSDRNIKIYFNNSKQELTHTLAHELGHALGMGHNDTALSIMYPQTNLSITPSEQDISALQTACRKVSIINIAQERLALILKQYKFQ